MESEPQTYLKSELIAIQQDRSSEILKGLLYEKKKQENGKITFIKGKLYKAKNEDIIASVGPDNTSSKGKDNNAFFISEKTYQELLDLIPEDPKSKSNKKENKNEPKKKKKNNKEEEEKIIDEEKSQNNQSKSEIEQMDVIVIESKNKKRNTRSSLKKSVENEKEKEKKEENPEIEVETIPYKQLKVSENDNKKRTRKKRKKEQIEITEETEKIEKSQNEEPESIEVELEVEEQKESKKKPTKKSQKEKEKSFKKGKFNEKAVIVSKCEQMESKKSTIDDLCCVKCTNKEIIRSILTDNFILFEKILTSPKISTYFEFWGSENSKNSLELLFLKGKRDWLQSLINHFNIRTKSGTFSTTLPFSINQIQTGENNKYAYGTKTRTVQMGRGGREGNNALIHDFNSANTLSFKSIENILQYSPEAEMLDLIRVGFPDTNNLIENQIATCVRSGNRKLAGYLIAELLQRGGFGYNKFHEEVLVALSPSELSPFNKANILKKTVGQKILTPLHCAAINPNPEILNALLNVCNELSTPDEIQRKPIHYAAVCEEIGPLKLLISKQVDPREGDNTKTTPLMLACQYGRIENVRFLLEAEAKSNIAAKNRKGYAAIHYAAEFGSLEILKLLFENKADINLVGPNRMTALHLASAKGHLDCVEFLLEKGVKLLAKDKFKRNSLILAVKNGNVEIASILLSKGTPFNEPDSSKNYPIHYAAAYGFYECIETLIQAGADPNVVNSWNLTALTVAMQKNHFRCVKILLSYPQTDVNCKDDTGRTLVSLGMDHPTEASLEQLKFLIEEKNANLLLADLKGWTPLHYACNLSCSHLSSALYPDYWQKNIQERNEIDNESQITIRKIIELLCKHCDNLNITSNDHKTPLSLAILNNFETADYILSLNRIDLNKISAADTCIYHDLASILLEPKGRDFYYKISNKLIENNGNQNLVNLVDHLGFTPLLRFIEKYSENSLSFFEKIKNRLSEHKKILIKPNPNQKAKLEIKNYPTKQPIKGIGKGPRKYPTQSIKAVRFENELSPEEQIEITKRSIEEFNQNESQFIELIHNFINIGADPNKKVDKLKKYRENPNLLEEEEAENERKNELIPIIAKKTIKKKRITPYGESGLQNIFHIILAYPTENMLKYLLSTNNSDYNAQDDLLKTPMHIFSEKAPIIGFLPTQNIDILRNILIQKGFLCNINDYNDDTPLSIACFQNKMDFVKEMRAKSNISEINTINKKGEVPLIYWVKNKNIKIVEQLLLDGADPNFQDNKKRTSLHHAINVANADADASFELESLLIRFGANVNMIDKNGRTPLHYAFVKIGNPFENYEIDPVETVSSLLGVQDILINVQDNWGRTPLHYAAQRGSNVCGIYLLENKADKNIKDKENNSPLNVAFLNKHLNFVTLLIQSDSDITNPIFVPKKANTAIKQTNKTGKFHFGGFGQIEIENENDEQLSESSHNSQNENKSHEIENEEDSSSHSDSLSSISEPPKKNNNFGFGFSNYNQNTDLEEGKTCSCFIAAIKYGWQGVCYLLIQKGYSLLTAIEAALLEKKFKLVHTLLNKRSEKSYFQAKNHKEQTLLHLFAQHGRDCEDEIVEKFVNDLIFKGLDLKLKDYKGRSALHYASVKSFSKLCEKLLDLEVNPMETDFNNNTPFSLMLSSLPLNLDLVQKYLNKGCKLSELYYFKKVESQMTPLLYLISKGNKQISTIKWFLEKGASINDKDFDGKTCLIYAIRLNSKKLVNFIINHPDFDPNYHIDNQLKTPIHYVVTPLEIGSFENTEILSILSKKFDINAKDIDGKDAYYYSNLQDSGTMANEIMKLGANIKVNLVKRCGTSILEQVQWNSNLDFESDANKFIELSEKETKNTENQKDKKIEVDQHAESSQNLEVLYEDNNPFDCLLTKVDVKSGFWSENVFYKMQVLYEKNRDIYILFTRWGRINTSGQFQQTPFSTKEEAIQEFHKIFVSKTGNEWKNRENFVKITKKYQFIKFQKKQDLKEYLIPFDFKDKRLIPPLNPSNILKVMRLFSDVKLYKDGLTNYNINQNFMTLASLNKEHLLEAKQILISISEIMNQIQEEIKDIKIANLQSVLKLKENIAAKTSRFYELIPTNNYSDGAIPPIEHENQLSQCFGLVESLIDFEITSKILLGAHFNFFTMNPLDYIYNSLNIRMLTLNPIDSEYKLINRYIGNSHKIRPKFIKNIFAIERKGEAERIIKHKHLSNRLMLWHGSSLRNFLGILASGLRIAPPTANINGHAFGRGIYFADTFEKSWGYTHGSEKYVFMLICEVALGNMLQLNTFQQISGLDSQYQSVLGKGINGPNPKQNLYLANGCAIPIGKIIEYEENQVEKTRFLSHNEFVVYDESQVRIRYIVQLNTKYNEK